MSEVMTIGGFLVPAIFTLILKDFFDFCLSNRFSHKLKQYIIWLIYFLIDSVVSTNFKFVGITSMIYTCILLTVFCTIIYRDDVKYILLTVLFIICIGAVSELIIAFGIRTFLKESQLQNFSLFGSTCSKLIILIVVRIVKLFHVSKIRKLDYINWFANVSITAGSLYIIYVSSYETYFIQLFEVEPFRFIKKPINECDFNAITQLAYERIIEKDSYFEYISIAKGVEWDRLMIGMLQNPTVMDFVLFLNSVQTRGTKENKESANTPLNIIADIPQGGQTMKVFFPGGIGFLQQFNALFQILVNNPERTEGIAAFNYTEDKEYLNSEEKDHIVAVGRRYADMLLSSGYTQFKLIGYCMGGLVAIETARALLEAGANVLPVITIDTIPIVLEMEGDLLMERSFGLMVGADVSKAGHVKRDEQVQMALEILKDKNNGFIMEEGIFSLDGDLKELANCYKKQKLLSQKDRLERLKAAIPESSMQLSGEDMNRFDELFELYKRNYRCAIGYTPKPFAGSLCALSCTDEKSPFVPVMKPGTEAFLRQCALGALEVLSIRGNHLSCLQTPNVEELADLLDEKGE